MHWSVSSKAWLSLTPEPERELPKAIATLRSGGKPSSEALIHEQSRAQSLVLHGSERSWLQWLHDALELADSTTDVNPETELSQASALVHAVIANHHNLLLGLPGRAAEYTEVDRQNLNRRRVQRLFPNSNSSKPQQRRFK